MGLVDLLSDLSNFIWTNYANVPGGSDVGGQSATIKMANSVKIANLPTHVIIDADGNFSWGTESTILAPNPFADGGVEFWIPESDMEYSDRYVERVKRIDFDPETSQYNVAYSPMDGIDPDSGEPYPLPRFRELSDDEIIEQFGTVEVEIEGEMVEQPNTGGYEEWLEYMDNAGLKEQSPIRIRSEGERNLELLMSRIVEQPGVLNNIPYEVEEGLVGSWFDINWSDDVFDFDSTDLIIPPGSSYTDIVTLPPTEGIFRSQIQDIYENPDLDWTGNSPINTTTIQSSLFGTNLTGANVHKWSLYPDFETYNEDSELYTMWTGNYLSRVNLGRIADGEYGTFPYEEDSSVPPSIFRTGDASPYTLQIPPHFGSNLTIPVDADNITEYSDMSSLLGSIWNLAAYTAGAQGPSGNLSQFHPWSNDDIVIDDNTGYGAPRVSLGKIGVFLTTQIATFSDEDENPGWTYVDSVLEEPGSPNFDRSGNLKYFGSTGLFPDRLPYVIPPIDSTGPTTSLEQEFDETLYADGAHKTSRGQPLGRITLPLQAPNWIWDDNQQIYVVDFDSVNTEYDGSPNFDVSGRLTFGIDGLFPNRLPYVIPKQHDIDGNYTLYKDDWDSPHSTPSVPYVISDSFGVQTPAGLPLLFGNLNVSQLESRLSSSFLPSNEGDWTDIFGHNYSALSTLTSNIAEGDYPDGWRYSTDSGEQYALPDGIATYGLESYHSNLMPIAGFTGSLQTSGNVINIPSNVTLHDVGQGGETHFRSWIPPKPYNMTGQYTMSISSKYSDLSASTPASDIIYFGNLSPVTSVDNLSGNAYSRYTGSNASFIPINQGDWKDPFGHSYEAKDTLTSNILHNGVWAQDYEDGWMYSTGSGNQYSGINLEQYYARTRPAHDKTGSFTSYDDSTHIATFLIPSKSAGIAPEGLDITDPTKPLFGNWDIEAIVPSMASPTSPGTGTYDGISNKGPFTLYTQLGDSSSPKFGHIGFHAGSKYGDVVLISGLEPALDQTALSTLPILRSISGERGDPNNVWPDRSRLWASSIDSTMTGNEINLNSLAIDTGNWKKYTEPYSKQIGDLAWKGDKLRPWDIVWKDSKETTDGRLYFGGEVEAEKYDVHTQYNFRTKDQTRDDATNPYLSSVTIAGSRQPYILRTLSEGGVMDKANSTAGEEGVHAWTQDDYTKWDWRRGMLGAIPRTVDDELRIGSFMLSDRGIGFMAKQYLFHGLNPRKESRLWSPTSIFKSLIPGFHARSNTLLDTGDLLGTAASFLGFGGDEHTYEKTVTDNASLLYQSAKNIGDQEKLVKIHNDWRTTPAHKLAMVPSEGGKMTFGGYVIGGAAEETVKSGILGSIANWLTGGNFKPDGTIEFGKPRSPQPYKYEGQTITPTPKYGPEARYLVTGKNTFLQGAPKPGSLVIVGTEANEAYTIINTVKTQLEKTEVDTPAASGYDISYMRKNEDGSFSDERLSKTVNKEQYDKISADDTKYEKYGLGLEMSSWSTPATYKYSYKTWAPEVVTNTKVPFEVGTLGWKAAGSPILGLSGKEIVNKDGIYSRGIPASIQEDGVYDQDLYSWGSNYSRSPKAASAFTIDKTGKIVTIHDVVYTHLPSRADHPAAHGRSPNIHTTKYHGISTWNAKTQEKETAEAKEDLITESGGVTAEIIGKKSWLIGVQRTPVFVSDFLGQSVFHSATKAGWSEFAGDEFGNNFKNLSSIGKMFDTTIDDRGGLGVAKYYINGAADTAEGGGKKYLKDGGGHRIGIGGEDIPDASDQLIAISAVNYRHPITQWPSTPKIKTAYGNILSTKIELEDTEIVLNDRNYVIRKITNKDTTTGITLDGINEYSSGGKYGDVWDSKSWPNVLNPEVLGKPDSDNAEANAKYQIERDKILGPPPDDKRFRLGIGGSHLSVEGRDFVSSQQMVGPTTFNILGDENLTDDTSVKSIPIAIAKTTYIHPHWPTGGVVNRFTGNPYGEGGVYHIKQAGKHGTEDKPTWSMDPQGSIIITPTYKDTTTGISVKRNDVFTGDRYGSNAKYGEAFGGAINLQTNIGMGTLPGSVVSGEGVDYEKAVLYKASDIEVQDGDKNVGQVKQEAVIYKFGLQGTSPVGRAVIKYKHPDGQWPTTDYIISPPSRKADAVLGAESLYPITFTDVTTGQSVFQTSKFTGNLYNPGRFAEDSNDEKSGTPHSRYQKSDGLQQYFLRIPEEESEASKRYITISDDTNDEKTLKLGVQNFKEMFGEAEFTEMEKAKTSPLTREQITNKLKEERPTAKTYPTYLDTGRYSDHANLGEPGTLVTKVQGFEGFYSGLLHKKDNELLRAAVMDNPTTSATESGDYFYSNPGAIKGYAVLSYGMIPGGDGAYDPNDDRYEHGLRSPSELVNQDSEFDKKGYKNKEGKLAQDSADEIKAREDGKQRIYSLGQQGLPGIKPTWSSVLGGLIKKSDRVVDKVNILPYGGTYGDTTIGAPDTNTELIPFRFRDAINGKWIIFRAILGAITDTVTADWAEEKYVGRPEQVYVYQGAGREVSFAFDIYPTTRQELPVLWEKLNYLVGLCYPSYYSRSGDTSGGDIMSGRMVGPWIYLTIGDMFNNSPGFLTGVTVTTGDETTWETDGTKLPKHITVDCTFKYIGNHQLMTTGKHYDLPGMNGNKAFGNYDTSPQGLTRPDGGSIGKDSLKSYVTK